MLHVARLSFAMGFTTVLLSAAAVAAIAALLTFGFVSAAETAPAPPRAAETSELPAMLD